MLLSREKELLVGQLLFVLGLLAFLRLRRMERILAIFWYDYFLYSVIWKIE